MTKSNTWMLKAPIPFKEKLDRIRIERIKSGKDKKMTSYKRLCLAISRHDKFLNDLVNADLREDNRGQMNSGSMFNIFTFIIIAFVVVLFYAGLVYVQTLLSTNLIQIGEANPQLGNWNTPDVHNLTQAAQVTFGQVTTSIQSLRLVAAIYLLVLAIGMIITNALMKIHPLWFFVYILMALLAIVFSVPVSNSYQQILNSGMFNGELANFTIANWIMINLPLFVLILSILGGVFLFINLIRTGENDLRI